jgi:CRISPR/Cas system-associated exonuclease Cas4 (RecB family)
MRAANTTERGRLDQICMICKRKLTLLSDGGVMNRNFKISKREEAKKKMRRDDK